jgi:hypothetical protein
VAMRARILEHGLTKTVRGSDRISSPLFATQLERVSYLRNRGDQATSNILSRLHPDGFDC